MKMCNSTPAVARVPSLLDRAGNAIAVALRFTHRIKTSATQQRSYSLKCPQFPRASLLGSRLSLHSMRGTYPSGAVIVGRITTVDDHQRESFLRYRAGLSTVTVLG